jgi:hypothetical protein
MAVLTQYTVASYFIRICQEVKMKLPYYENVIISQMKITGVLLSRARPERRNRAKFFTNLGFSSDTWEVLAQALLRHAADHEVTKIEVLSSGIQYVIDGPIFAPNGQTPLVRAIWFIPIDESLPRFITAYPI